MNISEYFIAASPYGTGGLSMGEFCANQTNGLDAVSKKAPGRRKVSPSTRR
jgi:hypothetical protein